MALVDAAMAGMNAAAVPTSAPMDGDGVSEGSTAPTATASATPATVLPP